MVLRLRSRLFGERKALLEAGIPDQGGDWRDTMIPLVQLVARLRCWCGFVGYLLKGEVGGGRYLARQFASRGMVLELGEVSHSLSVKGVGLVAGCIRTAREEGREAVYRIEKVEDRREERIVRSRAFWRYWGRTVRCRLAVNCRAGRTDPRLSCYFQNTCWG